MSTNHAQSLNYDEHGHVGFAWGARREVLEKCPLYEKALIGGADHILAHAAAGQISHDCITKSFTDNLADIQEWSRDFNAACDCQTWNGKVLLNRIGYVNGDLYHIWHGEVSDRAYLKRIREFTGSTKELTRDKYGFYTAKGKNAAYMKRYYRQREVAYDDGYDFGGFDDGFYEDMGYMIYDLVNLFGQSPVYYDDPQAGVADPYNQPDPNVLPFSMGGVGVSDQQSNDFLPFNQGGAGVSDDGRHIITDDQLQGAVIGNAPDTDNNAANAASDALDAAIHSASLPDDPAPADVGDSSSGNFS